MSRIERSIRFLIGSALFVAAMTVSGLAAAVSWTYLGGPFGAQPEALLVDGAGNTWAGLNSSGVYFRAAGTNQWVSKPGLPTQGNNAFAIGGTGIVYVAGSGGVYALAADGSTWNEVDGDHGLPGGAGGAMISDAQGAVYVGAGTNGGVYKLASGATTWTAVGTGLPTDRTVNAMTFDSAGNFWAAVYGAGIYKLAAGGTAWSAVNSGLDNNKVQALAAVGADIFAGVQFGGAYKLVPGAGSGQAWTPWNGGSLAADDALYDFAVGAGNTLYAAGYGVIHALAAGASTWTQVGSNLSAYGPTYAIAYSNADGALTIGNGSGILTLPAGGSVWQLNNDGMTASTIYGLVVADNGDLYAATFGQGVQRLAVGTANWTPMNAGNSALVVEAIVKDGQGTLFISGGGNVLKLVGGSWTAAGTDLNGFAYTLAVDAANGLWAGQSGSVAKLASGATAWTTVGSGLPEDQAVRALAFDAAGTAYAVVDGEGVYSLPSGSGTWVLTNTGLEDEEVRTLTRDATGTLYAGTTGGVFKRVAGAWQPVGTAITDQVYALAFDTNGDLYAGVDNGYAWRLAAGQTEWVQVRRGMGSRTAIAFAVGGGRLYAGTDAGRGSPSGVYVYVPLDSVVEFYNSNLDNFFITANPAEQDAVANGDAGPGWSATGNFFNAGGPAQVCRFYGSITPGPNSHFYTINPAECQSLKDLAAATPATQQRWNFESYDFSSAPAVGGGCAAGLVPVYRAYNNGFGRHVDSNHRITSNYAAYLAQVAKGWAGEGVVMCAPAQ